MARVKWDISEIEIVEKVTPIKAEAYEEKMKLLATLVLRSKHSAKIKGTRRRKSPQEGATEAWKRKVA